jgi:hypothetical protein
VPCRPAIRRSDSESLCASSSAFAEGPMSSPQWSARCEIEARNPSCSTRRSFPTARR